ncbi:uncharacterized protein SPAPADRAFT_153779 [Spathaspora passalidarum NRRL Y-27907]|uniref:MutL C-terminal dimerisation domain-containing protein n=1 Tax=Spathaspora passalidarum (strain NRRL Y-27907 / 11-Y1) TaxID=619300 RepID=G3ANZ4_SPAPN|nr:uncharacterized protein SPAPADRAFT_153779 [Spathaspora passalidarum NRRL Y-27907]EGW32619.1 hypothetical protein SPAPADRAFT_153779 [Spathaspora passalidarum NRRL Y-27907]
MHSNDGNIHKLDESILSQIKAQTQITSIDAAIKELLQNSLDASADEILIKLDLKSLSVLVKDNGIGIAPDDLEQVASRNSTSKLTKLADLNSISTFGFKGEALYSLRSMSRLTIVSKCKNYNSPFRIQFTDSRSLVQIFDAKESNTESNFFSVDSFEESGTFVIATNIFSNMPIRREQILAVSRQRILNEIRLAILQSLVKHPRINLKLFVINQDKMKLEEIISLNNKTKGKNMKMLYSNLLFCIFGMKIKCETISARFKDFEVDGIIGINSINSKSHQYIFLNGRPFIPDKEDIKQINGLFTNSGFCENRMGIDSIMSPTKTTGRPFYRFPMFLITIKCPMKAELLFQDPSKSLYYANTWSTVYKILEKIFIRFLGSHGRTQRSKSKLPSPSPFQSPTKKINSESNFLLNSNNKLDYLRNRETKDFVDSKEIAQKPTRPKINLLPIAPSVESVSIPRCQNHNFNERVSFSRDHLKPGNFRIIKQIDKKFILVNLENVGGLTRLVVLDQHASDERVRVEQLFKEFVSLLLAPGSKVPCEYIISLTSQELDIFNEYKQNFDLFAITYELRNESEILITNLPSILLNKINDDVHFLKNSLLQHCYDLMNHVKNTKVDLNNWWEASHFLPRVLIEIISSNACRSAIMFGDELTMEEMNDLLIRLSECNLPFQCAHGRPSIVPLATIK